VEALATRCLSGFSAQFLQKLQRGPPRRLILRLNFPYCKAALACAKPKQLRLRHLAANPAEQHLRDADCVSDVTREAAASGGHWPGIAKSAFLTTAARTVLT
jgi:hypothetical protein